jgi:hypothetical protein
MEPGMIEPEDISPGATAQLNGKLLNFHFQGGRHRHTRVDQLPSKSYQRHKRGKGPCLNPKTRKIKKRQKQYLCKTKNIDYLKVLKKDTFHAPKGPYKGTHKRKKKN